MVQGAPALALLDITHPLHEVGGVQGESSSFVCGPLLCMFTSCGVVTEKHRHKL